MDRFRAQMNNCRTSKRAISGHINVRLKDTKSAVAVHANGQLQYTQIGTCSIHNRQVQGAQWTIAVHANENYNRHTNAGLQKHTCIGTCRTHKRAISGHKNELLQGTQTGNCRAHRFAVAEHTHGRLYDTQTGNCRTHIREFTGHTNGELQSQDTQIIGTRRVHKWIIVVHIQMRNSGTHKLASERHANRWLQYIHSRKFRTHKRTIAVHAMGNSHTHNKLAS